MRMIYILSLIFFNSYCFAIDDSAELSFSVRVKAEIERTFLEGQQRYDYDDKRTLTRSWRDRNISAQDMQAYLNAYNTAHDLERKIRLSNELKSQKYFFTDFSEHISPLIPNLKSKSD